MLLRMPTPDPFTLPFGQVGRDGYLPKEKHMTYLVNSVGHVQLNVTDLKGAVQGSDNNPRAYVTREAASQSLALFKWT